MTTTERNKVISNVKFLIEKEGAKIATFYQNGQLDKGDKLLFNLYIVIQYYNIFCAYNPSKVENWITNDEADVLVDFLQKHYKACNLKTETLTLPLPTTDGNAIYSDGTFIELSNAANLRYS